MKKKEKRAESEWETDTEDRERRKTAPKKNQCAVVWVYVTMKETKTNEISRKSFLILINLNLFNR